MNAYLEIEKLLPLVFYFEQANTMKFPKLLEKRCAARQRFA